MIELITAIVSAAVILGALDYVWLGFVAKKLYYGEMGDILLKKPNMTAALLFYAIYVVGAVIMVVLPALAEDSFSYALGYGALLGFLAYATYDLTNLATLKGFSSKIVVIDLLWGTFITTLVCIGSFAAVNLVV